MVDMRAGACGYAMQEAALRNLIGHKRIIPSILYLQLTSLQTLFISYPASLLPCLTLPAFFANLFLN